MAAFARTPVFPKATTIGALSAQLRRTDGDPQCPVYVETGEADWVLTLERLGVTRDKRPLHNVRDNI